MWGVWFWFFWRWLVLRFFFFSVLLGVFFVDFFLSAVLELADETHWLN